MCLGHIFPEETHVTACNNGVPYPCRFDNSMSSSEEILLQSREEVEDGNHTKCTAPLEQEDSKQGATIRAVSPCSDYGPMEKTLHRSDALAHLYTSECWNHYDCTPLW